jgi:hypothetical protein
MVQRLIKKDFAGFHSSLPKTTRECFENGSPMLCVNQITSVIPQIEFELNKLAQSVNVDQRLTLQRHQVPVIAEMIYDNWKTISLEEVALCLKRGGAGAYGEIFRLDGAVITSWLTVYAEERAYLSEIQVQKEAKKHEEAEVDYAAFKKRLDEERSKQHIDKAMEANRKRTEAMNVVEGEAWKGPPKEDDVRKRLLHIDWIRENFDAKTGNKKPGWISEPEWLKKQSKP